MLGIFVNIFKYVKIYIIYLHELFFVWTSVNSYLFPRSHVNVDTYVSITFPDRRAHTYTAGLDIKNC